jgi:hypothetical protein
MMNQATAPKLVYCILYRFCVNIMTQSTSLSARVSRALHLQRLAAYHIVLSIHGHLIPAKIKLRRTLFQWQIPPYDHAGCKQCQASNAIFNDRVLRKSAGFQFRRMILQPRLEEDIFASGLTCDS